MSDREPLTIEYTESITGTRRRIRLEPCAEPELWTRYTERFTADGWHTEGAETVRDVVVQSMRDTILAD